jgi:hypothetical protein
MYDYLRTAMSVAQYGEDAVWQMVSGTLSQHNILIKQSISEYCVVDYQPAYLFREQVVGVSLKRYQMDLNWDRDRFQYQSFDDFKRHFDSYLAADKDSIISELRRAFFNPFNESYPVLNIKTYGFLNGDGSDFKVAPGSGIKIKGDHNHYLFTKELKYEDIINLISTVTEHHPSCSYDSEVYLYTSPHLLIQLYDIFNPTNINIPFHGGISFYNGQREKEFTIYLHKQQIKVTIKNRYWVPPKYLLAVSNHKKVMGFRDGISSLNGMNGGLGLHYTNDCFPLRAHRIQRDFGINVINRELGAVLYVGDSETDCYIVPKEVL